MSRFIAWAAFLLGITASTAANVAHARDELGPRLTAAFAPLALVLAVELAVRVQWRSGWRWTIGRWGGTGLVAAVTAVVSYRHQVELLGTYGEDALNAALLPLSIDGLMLTAAAALLALGRRTEPLSEPASEPASEVPSAQVTTDSEPVSEPLSEPTSEPVQKTPPKRPARPDDELLPLLRPIHSADPLTRYKVAKLTGVSTRQAERLVKALTETEGTITAPVNGHRRPVDRADQPH